MLAIILNMFYLKKEGNTNSLIRTILILFLTSTKSLQQAFNGKRRKYNSNLTIQGLLIKYHISQPPHIFLALKYSIVSKISQQMMGMLSGFLKLVLLYGMFLGLAQGNVHYYDFVVSTTSLISLSLSLSFVFMLFFVYWLCMNIIRVYKSCSFILFYFFL